jgi:hypothetical protein
MLVYLDGPGPRGTLRFADPDCEILPAVLPDASLSSATMPDDRRIVVSGDDLVIVDAAAGAIEPFEPNVERVLTRANGPFLVQADGHLSVYDDHWRLQQRYGEGVIRFGYIASRVVFEDTNGIWVASPGVAANLVAPGACELGFSLWQPLFFTFRKPCTDGTTVAVRPDLVETVQLGHGVSSAHAEFWMEGTGGDQALWVAYYRDFDDEQGVGTLVLRAEDGSEQVLGERAAPEWLSLLGSGTAGFTLVNVDGDVGDYVRFETSGDVRLVAERTLRSNDGVGTIVHFDGVAGDMGNVNDGGGFQVLLERVPRDVYTYVNRDISVGAGFHDFDGRSGTLSRFTRSFLELETVATGVLHPHHGFIDTLFPGMAWIRAEGGADTGTLEYQNTELVYTATVSRGVAAFLPTTEGLIYSVPRGAGAGVWFAEAK